MRWQNLPLFPFPRNLEKRNNFEEGKGSQHLRAPPPSRPRTSPSFPNQIITMYLRFKNLYKEIFKNYGYLEFKRTSKIS